MEEQKFPSVSVIVPLFNKRSYVRRCLESIRQQHFSDFEVIVVDDGSTDGSAESVTMFRDKRYRMVRQANGGAASARNRGIEESRAELVAFLDADDEWCPDFLGAIVSLAQQFPSAGLFGTGFRRCRAGEPDRETTLNAAASNKIQFQDYLEKVQEGDFITSSSVAVRREVFESVGTFRRGEHIGEDVELWARIALQFPFAFDTRILAVYHSEALGRSFERWRSDPPYPPVVSCLRKLMRSGTLPEQQVSYARFSVDYRLMNHAHWLLTLRKRKELRAFLATECFGTRRFRTEALLLRALLAVLPARVVFALRWKPGRIKARLVDSSNSGWKGDFVLTREIPRQAVSTRAVGQSSVLQS